MKKNIASLILVCWLSICSGQQTRFNNPVLGGFYPDPSICRAGDDYYLTTSSFAYFPGLPLFHSKDLVSWKQIGHAMDRPEQLNLDSAGVSRGLFAPTIRYHKGVFYIVCTLVDKTGNFVITATDPAGPWSNPVALPAINGIDPSLFFDTDDKAYIVYNSIPPFNKPLYNGHRSIRMYEFDWQQLKVKGDEIMLVNGGTDISKKPVWIEAPHQFKKDGWYYLICAEGGTAYDHSEVVFRSQSVNGPYIAYENNPILTQRQLSPDRPAPVTSTGHADFTQAPDGSWWAVFLGCRPYTGDHYNTGRETFMAPVTWKDGWPHILDSNEHLQYQYPAPVNTGRTISNPFSGNVTFHDDFNKPVLNPRWIFLRTPRSSWYSLSENKGALTVQPRPESLSGKENPSLLAHRQQQLSGSASTSLQFLPASENEKAGLVIFQNETHYYFLCKTLRNGHPAIVLYRGPGSLQGDATVMAYAMLRNNHRFVELKITFNKQNYQFWYKEKKRKWRPMLQQPADGTFLSTETAGGFVGAVFALYAVSDNQQSQQKAIYHWFSYQGNDKR